MRKSNEKEIYVGSPKRSSPSDEDAQAGSNPCLCDLGQVISIAFR